MLEYIKSKYIVQIIFLYINEKRKLFLIKFNNKIKERLNINLFDYKFLSGKYFIGKKNGKGKEYNILNDELIFEGDYIDDKRTGYGKEYYEKEKIRYEGKYLNGKRNGKGKEYYKNGSIKFEGIYLFGLKYKGKGYDKYGKILYELENGKGFVKEINDINKIIFEGEYPNGKGKEYFYKKDKIKFEGDYINGIKWNGYGYDLNDNIIYELKNGRGYIKELDYYGNIIYEGEYAYGKRNGRGKEYYNKKIIFDGIYLNNYKKKGKEYVNDKLEFEGEYFIDKKWTGKGYDKNGNIIYELNNGKGKIKEYQYNDLFYEGEYFNGRRNGKGKEYKYGNLIYEGEYLNGKKNGKGKYYDKYEEFIYEGEYLDNQKNGIGKEYKNGKLIFEGEFSDNQRDGKGKEFLNESKRWKRKRIFK